MLIGIAILFLISPAKSQDLADGGFRVVYLKYDKNFPLDVLDFNLTTINVNFRKFSILNTQIPIKVWERNETKQREICAIARTVHEHEVCEGMWYKEISNLKISDSITFNIFKGSEIKSYNFNLNSVLEFGFNSTEIEIEIIIMDVEHLNETKGFIRNIYAYVNETDGITYTIPNGQYVRAYFVRNLTNQNAIDIVTNNTIPATIEVYEKDSSIIIGKIENVTKGVYYIELNHSGSQYIFDMKSVGNVTYDYIHDATHLNSVAMSTSPTNGNMTVYLGNSFTMTCTPSCSPSAIIITNSFVYSTSTDCSGNKVIPSSGQVLITTSVNPTIAVCGAVTATIVANSIGTVYIRCNATGGVPLDLVQSPQCWKVLVNTSVVNVNFTSPTPSNATTQTNKDIYVNVSSSSSVEHSVTLDFNRTLALWLRMDDINASNDPWDRSSWSNNGSKFGAVQNSTGKFGKSFQFDGTNDLIIIADTDSLDFDASGNYTFEMWIKPNTAGIFGGGLVFKGISYTNGFSLFTEDASGPFCAGDNLVLSEVCSSAFPIANQWQHVVYTYSNKNWSLYVNRTYYALGLLTDTVSSMSGAIEIGVGDLGSTGGTRYFNGIIDDVKIYRRVLSSQEINASYNASTSSQYYNNFTNLANGTYTFTAYAQDTTANLNQTEQRQVTIGAIINCWTKTGNVLFIPRGCVYEIIKGALG